MGRVFSDMKAAAFLHLNGPTAIFTHNFNGGKSWQYHITD